MRKIIECGKIDYSRKGRYAWPVTVEIELADTGKGPVFSASASVCNPKRTQCVQCGQCFDTLAELSADFRPGGRYGRIVEMWRRHHFNDMHPGTVRQEKILDDYRKENPGWRYDYDEACGILRKHRAFVDRGYRYGTAWLYREIPEEDLAEIRGFFENAWT